MPTPVMNRIGTRCARPGPALAGSALPDNAANQEGRAFRRRLHAGVPPCSAESPFYTSPVLDIKLIREKPDSVRQRLATRWAGDQAFIDKILQADEQRRKFLTEVEALKS